MTRFYLKLEQGYGVFRVFDSVTKRVGIMKTETMRRHTANDKHKQFYDVINSSWDKVDVITDEMLQEYGEKFRRWVDELKNNSVCSVDWCHWFSNSNAVLYTFSELSGSETRKGSGIYRYTYQQLNSVPIRRLEGSWMRKCRNSHLVYSVYDEFVQNAYSYDYKLFYPNILASKTFKIPTKEGKEMTIESLPELNKDIKLGYYRVRITSDHPHLRKVWFYSEEDVYTSSSLIFARVHQELFNFQIELIVDDEPNCYVYDDEDVTTGDKVFGRWLSGINWLRKEYPDNQLVKHLASTLWGKFSEYNRRTVTSEDIEREGLDIGIDETSDYCVHKSIPRYVNGELTFLEQLQNNNQYFKHNLRIKPFLMAAGRNKIARLVMRDIDNVLRVYTDCVTFRKEQVFDATNEIDKYLDTTKLAQESKSSGMIYFKNPVIYNNMTLTKNKIARLKSSITESQTKLKALIDTL